MANGFASLDECEDQVGFWEAWNEPTRDERTKMGIMIGKKMSDLMTSKDKSVTEIREDLAKFILC